ncbi:ROK family protein [Lentisphaerota bacterium ZTH]|nr:ROK family protein [Lentisphaerota bacterium]WET06349.1 ROK family protein [Lentisphaerota bacterium ZTH]
MKDNFPVLGFDIGGTKIGVGLVTSDGKLLGKDRIANKHSYPDDILPQMVEIGKRLVADAGLNMDQVRAIGIASPAPADFLNGIITCPTNQKHWINVPIVEYISEHFGIETHFDNDANAGMLAEWFFGAGRGFKDVIYLTMSTGIGGGVIANGHLIKGASLVAGEIGHMVLEPNGIKCNCGLTGCYEAYCGGLAVAQRLQKELADKPDHPVVKLAGGKIENVDMIALEKGVMEGEEYSVKLWEEICERNAQAYGILMNTFNPERIILGTLAWATGDMFLDPVKKHLPRFAWKQTMEACELVKSELRRDIGYFAGPAVALNGLYEKGCFERP